MDLSIRWKKKPFDYRNKLATFGKSRHIKDPLTDNRAYSVTIIVMTDDEAGHASLPVWLGLAKPVNSTLTRQGFYLSIYIPCVASPSFEFVDIAVMSCTMCAASNQGNARWLCRSALPLPGRTAPIITERQVTHTPAKHSSHCDRFAWVNGAGVQ